MKVIDLFAGCGGMTLGFVRAGFEPVLAVEWDIDAASTYAANFDPDVSHTLCRDIADVNAAEVPEADVVIGGPPCQGFSTLGHQDDNDPRNTLWREYVRVLQAANPSMFVIENVDRFVKSPEFGLLQREVESGALSQYKIVAGVLNAADYGVPQKRRRTIVIGSRVGEPLLPRPTRSADGASVRSRWKTVESAIGSVRRDPRDPKKLGGPSVDFFEKSVPGPFSTTQMHVKRNPTAVSLERYDVIPPGGGRFDLMKKRPDLLPPCWANKKTGTTDVMGRLRWDEPSVTIRTEFFKPEKGRYLHPQWDPDDPENRVNRPITHREAALLQTFPHDYQWCGSKIQIAKQIGNAVPPVLAEAIARSVRKQIETPSFL